MVEPFDPNAFVIAPPEPVRMEHRSDGAVVICWREPAHTVKIDLLVAAGEAGSDRVPLRAAIDRVAREAVVALSDLPAPDDRQARTFFAVELDGRHFTVAERLVPLPGGVNFRDLGGYETTDGHVVRWGQVFRAGSLADLSDETLLALGGLGLHLACDLRSPDEVSRHPDRLPPGVTYLHRPIVGEVSRLRRVVTLYRKRHRVQELLEEAYRVMLDQNGAVFAGVLRLAADSANRPLVIHCTAGKEHRTGLAAALLLLALGVPEETVIADYTLSNHAFDVLENRMRPEMERLYSFGFGEVQLRPFLLAEARTLRGTLAWLRRRYGSLEWYLQRAGLEETVVEALRAELLE